MRSIYHRDKLQRTNALSNKFLLLLIPMFLWLFADSYMAYGFPIILEEALGGTIAMGLVMSFSSIAGITMDFLMPRIFADRSWRKILLIGFAISLLFPLATYLGVTQNSVLLFLLASAIWGIEYEFMMFGNQDFVSNEEKTAYRERDWTLFNIIWHIAILIAPILAGVFILQGINRFTGASILFYVLALIIFMLITFLRDQQHRSKITAITIPIYEFAKFRRYFKKLLFPFLATSSLVTINTLYWNLAGLFGLQLSITHGIPDWAIFTSYSLGQLIGILVKLKFSFKNKQAAISWAILIAGLLLFPIAIVQQPWLICLMLFLSSAISAYSIPMLAAIYSTEADKAKDDEMYVLSIERVTVSFAYIVMPTFLGIFAAQFGFAGAFSVIGLIAILAAIVLLIMTYNRKQKEAA